MDFSEKKGTGRTILIVIIIVIILFAFKNRITSNSGSKFQAGKS